MTTFKCRTCGGHWSEGPTRDHRTDAACRHCLQENVDNKDQRILDLEETLRGPMVDPTHELLKTASRKQLHTHVAYLEDIVARYADPTWMSPGHRLSYRLIVAKHEPVKANVEAP